MKRRALFAGIAGWVARPQLVHAQPSGAPRPRVVYLGVNSASMLDPRQIEGFKRGLVENDLIDGRDITVDYAWAEGSQERLHSLCLELAKSDAAIIVTAGPQSVRELLAAKATQPIVVAIISDPVGAGLVTSLARPGGSITGLSMSNSDLEGKRLELLQEAVPTVRRILVLHDPSMATEGVASVKTAARSLGVEVVLVETNEPAAFEATFTSAANQGVDGVSVMASPFFNYNRTRLIELATRHRLPSVWEASNYVRDGGLLSYGPSFADMYRRSAGYVARLLKGAKPADLPIEQPTLFEFVVNRKTAASLGIVIPWTVLSRADELIE
jgi:putative ABC transport system substrate-binding protein